MAGARLHFLGTQLDEWSGGIDFDDAMHLALLRAVRSDEPPGYFLDEPAEPSRRMEPVFTPLAAYSFGKMEVATITSRDGWPMVAYLTRAARLRADGRLVLVVHGGPYDRDRWGYVPVHQWLADRGYSVLSVNFRGSTGFGKAFTGAARHEWGGRMQDDLSDAVGWAVARGIADPDRVAIYGVSYGGYAALMGVARDPHIFACAVDVCGPSSLLSFVEGIPESWKSWFPTILQHLATPQTSEGRDWLLQRSPLHLVSAIQHPVLIVQGLRDARVAATESTEMFKALSDNGAEVTYLAFSDEGHFFTKTTNRLLLASVVERFLARHLGGLFEPTDGGFESQSVSALGSMVLRGDIRQSQDIHQNNGSGMKGKV